MIMDRIRVWIILGAITVVLSACKDKSKTAEDTAQKNEPGVVYNEEYRPQFHFTPPEMWMNDPNGLVYNDGVYHLFYQYYPDDIVWGPMHWGHAISEDMIFWEHKPIALYPDEKGYIFSGSAVVDKQNTSGFGTAESPPLVAVFTYHDIEGEKANTDTFQTQGIAYSLDNGDSWTKYEGNPVIDNSGIRDFRDPKVFWHGETQSWIMALVAGDHAKFYRSPNLIDWTYISEFGREQGAHGGVWECPDLFQLQVQGSEEYKWVLLISINPNAPNGGSGTQYFIGDFDGTTFTSDQKEARWLDWGRDNYAGVTYNDAPNGDRIFIGWMSNWDYARDTPTKQWRSAMTLARKLSLKKIGSAYELINYPIKGLEKLLNSEFKENIVVKSEQTHRLTFDHFNESDIRFRTAVRDFNLYFANEVGDTLVVSMNKGKRELLFDRRVSGLVDFHEKFAPGIQRMPVDNLPDEVFEMRILIDRSSVEIFLNQGQFALTSQLFPRQPYTQLLFENPNKSNLILLDLEVSDIKSIWGN
jgi:fructan beta-fructosidase